MLKSNLAHRLVTAGVALPLLALMLFRGPALLLVGVIFAILIVGQWEFCRMLRVKGHAPFQATALLLLAALFFDAAFEARPPLWPLAMGLALIELLARKGDIAARVPAAALSLFGAFYLGALGGTMAALRTLEPLHQGPWRLLLLLVTIMAADTSAYVFGRLLGRRKLAPDISPGKTVEGGLAGLLGGGLAALAVLRLTPLSAAPGAALLLGIGVAAAGTIGDLVESLLKRWAGVKDSGGFFPGHGGALDRIDSLLLGAPVLYYYFLCCR